MEEANEYWDSSDDDNDSIRSLGDSSLRYEDIVGRAEGMGGPRTGESQAGQWKFFSHSRRGAQIFGGASTRVLDPTQFKLEYNSTDSLLLEKAKAEVRQSLHKAREKLFDVDQGQSLDAGAAMAATLPEDLLRAFHKYLKSGLKPNEKPSWSLGDIIEFLRCEFKMKLFGASANELRAFGVSKIDLLRFQKIRKALTKADIPPSKRKAAASSAAQIPAYSFDPIIAEGIAACNKGMD